MRLHRLLASLALVASLALSACSSTSPSSKYLEKAQSANRDYQKLMNAQKALCEKGSLDDCRNYARQLRTSGKIDEAREVLSAACEKGNGPSCVWRANYDFQTGRYGEAEEELNRSCEERPSAICALAGQIAAQKGSPQKAAQYFKRGCAADHLDSCTLYGRSLRIQNQNGMAAPPLRKACDAKEPPACTDLAMILWADGKEEQALENFDRDCELRSDRACRFATIARLKRADANFETAKTQDCKSNNRDACHAAATLQFMRKGGRALAMHRWRENCKAGHAISCWDVAVEENGVKPTSFLEEDSAALCEKNLGVACYFQGGIERAKGELKKAYASFRKACENGDSLGCDDAAKDPSLSDEERLKYGKIACDQGLKPSCRWVGQFLTYTGQIDEANRYLELACPDRSPTQCLNDGIVVKKSFASNRTAEELSTLCDQGDTGACIQNGERLAREEKPLESKTAFGKACDRKDGDACAYLAKLELSAKNTDIARDLYRRACDLDSTLGCEALLDLLPEAPQKP